ncbi:MAG: hypothetical protein EZS28_023128 [Streblomastix strix]|uniref:Uncharacterized protein n=1 Tax=Streblomastix strix TaxID=222440 RepID=A0A5J4VFL4_9EUKA|nr:MAG: hypothetical protein EZS28_023128 [Streblomastix strix]
MNINQQEEKNPEPDLSQIYSELESEDVKINLSALGTLLNIVIQNPECKQLILEQKLLPVLNKFAGNIDHNNNFVLSQTILRVIGDQPVNQSQSQDVETKKKRDNQLIFSMDEKLSKSGDEYIDKLIRESKEIRFALLLTGFIQTVVQALSLGTQQTDKSTSSTTSTQKSSSISQSEKQIRNIVIIELLDAVSEIVATNEKLESFASFIPLLEQWKADEEKDIRIKSINLLTILSVKGVGNNQKLQQLESEINNLKGVIIIQQYEKQKDNNEKLQKEDQIWQLKKNIDMVSKVDTEFVVPVKEDVRIEGESVTIGKAEAVPTTITIKPNMKSGITRLRLSYQCPDAEVQNFGIATSDVVFQPGKQPTDDGNQAKTIRYYKNGDIGGKGELISGNDPYKNGQEVSAEIDMTQKTLTFFVGEKEQPNKIVGLPENVCFYV